MIYENAFSCFAILYALFQENCQSEGFEILNNYFLSGSHF